MALIHELARLGYLFYRCIHGSGSGRLCGNAMVMFPDVTDVGEMAYGRQAGSFSGIMTLSRKLLLQLEYS